MNTLEENDTIISDLLMAPYCLVFSDKPAWYFVFVEPEKFARLVAFLQSNGYERSRGVKYDGYSKNFYRFEKTAVQQNQVVQVVVNVFFAIPELVRIMENEKYRKIADYGYQPHLRVEAPQRPRTGPNLARVKRTVYILFKDLLKKAFWMLVVVSICAVMGLAINTVLKEDVSPDPETAIINKLDRLEIMLKKMAQSEKDK